MAGGSAKVTQQYLPQKATVRKKFHFAAKHPGHSLAGRMRSVNVRDYYCYQYYIPLHPRGESKGQALISFLLGFGDSGAHEIPVLL